MAVANQVHDSAHQHCRFACPRTGNHQHGTVHVLDRLTLVGGKFGNMLRAHGRRSGGEIDGELSRRLFQYMNEPKGARGEADHVLLARRRPGPSVASRIFSVASCSSIAWGGAARV